MKYLWFDEVDLFVWMQQRLWGNLKFYVAYIWFFTGRSLTKIGEMIWH